MNVQNSVVMHVLGIKRYNLNGEKFAALYAVDQNAEQNSDSMGIMPLKMQCDYTVLDKLYPGALPGDCAISIQVKMGAQGKAGMFATECKPLQPGEKQNSQNLAQASAPANTPAPAQKEKEKA